MNTFVGIVASAVTVVATGALLAVGFWAGRTFVTDKIDEKWAEIRAKKVLSDIQNLN